MTRGINALAKNTTDKWYKLAQSSYEWCGVAINHSQTYLPKIQNSTKDEAMKQHRNLVQVLEKDLKEINSVQEKRAEIFQSFLEATRKNDDRLKKLGGDFNYKIKRDVITLIICLNVDAINSRRCIWRICWDTKLTRKIKSLIQKIETKLGNVSEDIDIAFKNSDSKIAETKNKFKVEHIKISDIMVQAKSALGNLNDIIEEDLHNSAIIKEINIFFKKLIEKCQTYRSGHKP